MIKPAVKKHAPPVVTIHPPPASMLTQLGPAPSPPAVDHHCSVRLKQRPRARAHLRSTSLTATASRLALSSWHALASTCTSSCARR